MSTALYLVGFIVLIAGLAWGALQMGVPALWVGIGVVVVAGIAIISIAGNLRDTEASRPVAPTAAPPAAPPASPPPAAPQEPREPREPREPKD